MTKSLTFVFALALAGLGALPARAQMTESELGMRLNRLENQVRQLTGQLEQLQHRNNQLEQQLRGASPPAAPPTRAAAPQPQYAPPPQQAYRQQGSYPQQQAYPQQAYPQQSYPQQGAVQQETEPAPPPRGGRRGDAFDPSMSPNAPGAPRTLGGAATIAAAPPIGDTQSDEQPYVGAPGGRQAGAPLDIGIMSEEAVHPQRGPVRQIQGALPAPPPRTPSGTGAQQMVMAPSNTPKDEYDLAYGYVLRKDYALAEEGLRAFLKNHPKDRLVADANYWLGESLFQRQRYREAAESFLTVSTKFDTAGKAPDSLLRLGQSLAALKEKDAACATLGELPRKYPKAPANVRQAAEKEQKRVGCS
jgi:tol-pal system protein YbgF